MRILDKGDQTDPLDTTVPSNQILRYLTRVEVASHGKLVWGILTNGKDWRLYYQRSPSRSEAYLEINFDDIFGSPTPKLSDYTENEIDGFSLFKIFILFFRKEAFVPTEWRTDKSFLEIALDEGKRWEKRVSESLKNLIFKDVFPLLAKGFYQNASSEDELTEDFLGTIYENTLIFLYRLLFLFYAEDRGLLPVTDSDYYHYSLTRIRKEIAQKIDENHKLSENATSIWDSLKNLTEIINKGDSTLGVPPYNGGLFKPELHPFLSKYSVPDSFMAPALDKLSRDYSTHSYKRISYRDLSIRQLGSVYEGLLEFKLRKAETNLRVSKKKGKEVYEETKDEAKATIKKGEIYLTNDKSERKATGSYYTPEYIVDYIVKNTLGPVVEEKRKSFSENKGSLVNAILSIKVLDPAMGSGHFLVDAIEFLAEKLLEAVQLEIEAGIVSNENLDYDSAKRKVLAYCIYGVDLNYLAVELAKVSLWLTTISKDKPLSFLDHRLKQGNSLVGSKIVDLAWLPGQRPKGEVGRLDKPLERVKKILEKVQKFDTIPDDTLDKIRKKEELFNQFKESDEYKRLKSLADVHTGLNFEDIDFEKIKDHYMELVAEAYFGDPQKWEKKFHVPWVQEAMKDGEIKKFFHWELEFPDVFFDKDAYKESPGFDVVIGNPPYLPVEEIEKNDAKYYQKVYSNILYRKYDSSILFITHGLELNRENGYCGMIVPVAWQTGENYNKFRNFILKNYLLDSIVNLPFDVFPDAYIDTCIAIFKKSFSEDTFFYVKRFEKREKLDIGVNLLEGAKKVPINLLLSTEDLKIFSSPIYYKFLNKLQSNVFTTLGNLTDSCQGIVESFYDYSETPHSDNYLPYLVGQGYRYEFFAESRKYIHLSPQSSLWKYYNRPRILIRRIVSRSNRLMATFVEEPFVCKKDLNPFIVATEDISPLYILANINSSFHSFLYLNFSTLATKDDFRQTTIQELRRLPIRRIYFNTSSETRKKALKEGKRLYEKYLIDKNITPLLDFIEDKLPKDENGDFTKEEEMSDVIHDLLDYLAKQMIDMNERKNKEIKEFLEWFESYIGIEIDDLTNKTKIYQYYTLDFDEFFNILKKNKNKIPVNVLGRELHKDLKSGFEGSLRLLSPLKDKIEATDNLIDQVIYKLYGLSDEEIKIVEEKI